MSKETEKSKLPSSSLSNISRGSRGEMSGSLSGLTARLPSIRSPRDLTLGASTKRVFVPNIPVRRDRKPKPEVKGSVSKVEAKKDTDKKKPPFRNRREYVQLPGAMFGEGVSQAATKKGLSHFSSGNQKEPVSLRPPTVIKPKLPTTSADCIETTEEDKHDEAYLSDHFIDDDDDDNPEDENQINPIIIPMNVPFKRASGIEAIIKKPKPEVNISPVKSNKPGKDGNKPIVKQEPLSPSATANQMETDLSDVEILLRNLKMGAEEEILLIELPGTLPPLTNIAKDLPDNQQSNSLRPTLTDFSEGCIGKMQVLKNGQRRFIIDGSVFNIISRPVQMQENVVSLQQLGNEVHLSCVGHVQHNWMLAADAEVKSAKSIPPLKRYYRKYRVKNNSISLYEPTQTSKLCKAQNLENKKDANKSNVWQS